MNKMKQIRNVIGTVILWLVIWQVVSMKIDNSIFLPSPIATAQSLQQLFLSKQFFIFTKICRVIGQKFY